MNDAYKQILGQKRVCYSRFTLPLPSEVTEEKLQTSQLNLGDSLKYSVFYVHFHLLMYIFVY